MDPLGGQFSIFVYFFTFSVSPFHSSSTRPCLQSEKCRRRQNRRSNWRRHFDVHDLFRQHGVADGLIFAKDHSGDRTLSRRLLSGVVTLPLRRLLSFSCDVSSFSPPSF